MSQFISISISPPVATGGGPRSSFKEEQMEANAEQKILVRKEQMLDEELNKFVNGINTSNKLLKTITWMGL